MFCFALLVALVFYIGGFKKFETTYEIQVLSDSAYGVGLSSVVTFSGVKVGEVKKLRILSDKEVRKIWEMIDTKDLHYEDIRVEMILQVASHVNLKEDSVVEIVGSGLVGDQVVNLTPGSLDKGLLPKGKPLIGVKLTGLGKLQKGIGEINFDVLIPNVRKIVMNLTEASDRIKATTEKVDELLGDLDRKNQISSMLDRMEHTINEVDSLITDSSDNIKNSVVNFNLATENLKNELGPILSSLRNSSETIETVITKNEDEIDSIIAEFKETAVNFNQFSEKVKKYPWTLIRKTKVDKRDSDLFPQTADIKLEKRAESKPANEPEKKKLFLFF